MGFAREISINPVTIDFKISDSLLRANERMEVSIREAARLRGVSERRIDNSPKREAGEL